jgi:hypothetical protein
MQYRIADVLWQRQLRCTAALAHDAEGPLHPINIVEL